MKTCKEMQNKNKNEKGNSHNTCQYRFHDNYARYANKKTKIIKEIHTTHMPTSILYNM
jgi:hypothetical protein